MSARSSWKTFFRDMLPSAAAMLLFSSYTILDGIFLSRWVRETALAGVNIAQPFINTLSGAAILLSMGTSTLCAFALDQGDREKANRIFSQPVAVILAISAVITVGVCLFAAPLAAMLGAGSETLPYTAKYLHVVCLFSLCFILSYCLEVMVKIDGRPYLATFGVAISFLVHIGLGLFLLRRRAVPVQTPSLSPLRTQ